MLLQNLKEKSKDLKESEETAKIKKTAVIMEVKQVVKNPNVPKRRVVIVTLIMKNLMKKVIVVHLRTSWKKGSIPKLTGIFQNQTSIKLQY